MSKVPIIQPDLSYTFADYFKLNADIEEIISYFGYSFQARSLSLPETQRELERLENLKSRIEEILPYVSLTNEAARREFLIAPVLMELIYSTQSRVKVEYPLIIDNQLKGEIDYYLQAKNELLIVEAKNADLQRGLTQLGVELIALDRASITSNHTLYGAVSIGNIWQFEILQRETKLIVQDLNLYRVPTDLEDLLRILVAILESPVVK